MGQVYFGGVVIGKWRLEIGDWASSPIRGFRMGEGWGEGIILATLAIVSHFASCDSTSMIWAAGIDVTNAAMTAARKISQCTGRDRCR